MSKLLHFNTGALSKHHAWLKDKIPGLDNYIKFSSFFNTNNVGLYDSSGTLAIPFAYQPGMALPAWDAEFDLHFDQIVHRRMQQLDQLHRTTGRPFRLLYSGGVDSTVMFAAFVDYYGLSTASKILQICCSPESMTENPWLWNKHIRPGNFKLTNSQDHNQYWNDQVITVMGEGADQLAGGLGSGAWIKFAKQKNLDIFHAVDQTVLENYLSWYKPNNDPDTVRYCATLLMQLCARSPIPVTNMYLLVWWYTLCLYWEPHSKRILLQSSQNPLPADTLSHRLVQFYNHNDWLQWSYHLQTNAVDMDHVLFEYKWHLKKYAIAVLDIPEYSSKSKWLSWPRVHAIRRTGCALQDDLHIRYDPEVFVEFCRTDNSFV